jgi:hypothetical protein
VTASLEATSKLPLPKTGHSNLLTNNNQTIGVQHEPLQQWFMGTYLNKKFGAGIRRFTLLMWGRKIKTVEAKTA